MKPSVFLALALPLFGLPAQAELKSHYTSVELKDCAMVDATSLQPPGKQEIDFYTVECPGFGGYEVIVSGVDMRYGLSLRHQGRLMAFRQPPGFHEMGGPRIEWRYEVTGEPTQRTLKYRALIYRLNSLDNVDGGKPRQKSELVVVRLQGAGTCMIGVVPPGANMNALARKLADDLSAPCLKN